MGRTAQKILEEHAGSLIVQNADLLSRLEAALEELAALKAETEKTPKHDG